MHPRKLLVWSILHIQYSSVPYTGAQEKKTIFADFGCSQKKRRSQATKRQHKKTCCAQYTEVYCTLEKKKKWMPIQFVTLQLANLQLATLQLVILQLATLTTRHSYHPDNSASMNEKLDHII
jgi:hypothetical protein